MHRPIYIYILLAKEATIEGRRRKWHIKILMMNLNCGCGFVKFLDMYCLLWDIYEAIIVSEIVSFFFHGKLVMHHEYCSVELSLVVCGTSSRKLGTSGE